MLPVPSQIEHLDNLGMSDLLADLVFVKEVMALHGRAGMLRQEHLEGKVPAAGKLCGLPDLAGLTGHHEVQKAVGIDLLVADDHAAFLAPAQAHLAPLHVEDDAKSAQSRGNN